MRMLRNSTTTKKIKKPIINIIFKTFTTKLFFGFNTKNSIYLTFIKCIKKVKL